MIRAVIVDDEERARNTLKALITEFCPELTVAGEASNVPDAVLQINKLKPDVVFLDIEMPEYNGFELLQFFREIDFQIVFVTAYSEYAVRAFEVSAADYLLKPVDVDSLVGAVEKVRKFREHAAIQQRLDLLKDALNSDEIRKIAVPMSDGLLFVEIADIVFLEADGAYTNIFLKNGSKILVSKKLGFFEDILNGRKIFFRTHRSSLININCIRRFVRGENTIVMDNNSVVALARDRKHEFEEVLKGLRLA
ncbi:MAG: LytTR family DNA-binding domain-containing protein [Bacteroidia bacterium]|nr:LytTR family DNA-binding domain-containing protein [Bacteroidia bacterium]